jgi:hexaprenyl diphosphate synthase
VPHSSHHSPSRPLFLLLTPYWLPSPQVSSKYLGSIAASVASNGILEDDDYFKNGIPAAKFTLTECGEPEWRDKSLAEIFADHRHVDPFVEVENDLQSITSSVKSVIGSDHPVLSRIAAYFFDVPGKRVRPATVVLVSRASSLATPGAQQEVVLPSQTRLSEITEVCCFAELLTLSCCTSPSLHHTSLSMPNLSFSSSLLLHPFPTRPHLVTVLCLQMMHTATLLHDDVIDESDERRGVHSVNQMFGNKLAILGGDFLLSRASVALARLRNPDVTELLSMVIEHLVKGEVMQIRSATVKPTDFVKNVDYYLTKSYYKTASLIANSCRSSALMAGHPANIVDACEEYGKYFGLCFQIIDDLLDFTGNEDAMGKPVHNDLNQGLATLPVLYAAQEFPELQDIVARGFKNEGDVERALEFVEKSDAIEKARNLALACASSAIAALGEFPQSRARSALISLVERVLERDR